MKMHRHELVAAVGFAILCGCGSAESVEDDMPLGITLTEQSGVGTSGAASFAITATSIEGLGGSLASVRPAVRTADPGHTPEYYLQPSSALGPEGR